MERLVGADPLSGDNAVVVKLGENKRAVLAPPPLNRRHQLQSEELG
jgi:hypothetical protein